MKKHIHNIRVSAASLESYRHNVREMESIKCCIEVWLSAVCYHSMSSSDLCLETVSQLSSNSPNILQKEPISKAKALAEE